MILVANSTPMVCDERTLHSFLTKRCSKQDLGLRGKAHCQRVTLDRGECLCCCFLYTVFAGGCIRLEVSVQGFAVSTALLTCPSH